jgi:hypothetical protein
VVKHLKEINVNALGRVYQTATFVMIFAKCCLGFEGKIDLIIQVVDADAAYELTSDDQMRLA